MIRNGILRQDPHPHLTLVKDLVYLLALLLLQFQNIHQIIENKEGESPCISGSFSDNVIRNNQKKLA